jgi:hypothetical protein
LLTSWTSAPATTQGLPRSTPPHRGARAQRVPDRRPRAAHPDDECHQHVRIALRDGILPAEIGAIVAGDTAPLGADERALIGDTRAFVNREVDDATAAAPAEADDEPTVVGTSLLAGFHVVTALLTDPVPGETEEPFVGWDLERL